MSKGVEFEGTVSQGSHGVLPAARGPHDLYRDLFLSNPSALVLFDCATLQIADCNDLARALLLPQGGESGLPSLTDCLLMDDPLRLADFCSAPADDWTELRARSKGCAAGAGDLVLRLKRLPAAHGNLCQAVLHPAAPAGAPPESTDQVYASIFAHAGIGLTVIDPSMRILSMNPTIRSWFPQIELDRKPFCYASFNEPPRDTACSYCPTVKVLEDGQPHSATTATPTPDGVRHYSMIATPVFSADGTISCVIETAEDVTGRLLLEQQSAEKSRNLQGVLDNAPIAIWYKGVDGRFRFVNKSFCRQMGLSEEQFLAAEHFSALLAPEIASCCARSDAECLAQDEPHVSLEAFRFADGKSHLLSVTKAKLTGDDGEVLGVVGLGVDITEQQLSAERLQLLTDGFLRFGPDFSANINILAEATGRILGAACTLFNLLEEGMLCSVGQWQTPLDFQAMDRPEGHICYELIKSGARQPRVIRDLPSTSYAITDPNVLRYGLQSYVGVPVCWGDQVIGVLCALFVEDFEPSAADLSFMTIVAAALGVEEARRRSERAQKSSDRRYHALFSQTEEGIFVMSERGVLLEVNQAFAAMHGYSVTEMVGMDLSALDTPETLQQAPERLRRLLAGEHLTFEVEHYHRDGGVCSLEVSSSLIDCDGETNIISFHRDITARKLQEAERRSLERQFQQAQKLESLGVLAGGVAHDFNNILGIISGYCSLLSLEEERCADYLPEIARAVERAAELCRQMLAYAGKTKFVRTRIDLVALMGEMVGMLRSTLSQNVVIRFDKSVDFSPLLGDAGQLRQVVMNLIINAAEAIGEAQGEIRVVLGRTRFAGGATDADHLGKEIPPGNYACLEVSDSGCGMDEETRLRIFEPFFTTKFSGRGLGMSAVLGIINTHGGALQLFSLPGQGTRFRIYLPLLEEAGAGDAPLPQSAAPVRWRGSGTVLLVEDEPMVRGLASTMLQRLGFEVVEAADGMEGVARYRERAAGFSLVVTDLGMPVMDGYQMLRELKRLDLAIPVVITTGFGDVDVASRISGAEFAGFLGKPYNFSQLEVVVRRVMDPAAPAPAG